MLEHEHEHDHEDEHEDEHEQEYSDRVARGNSPWHNPPLFTIHGSRFTINFCSKWLRQTISEKGWQLNTTATLPLCSKSIIALREICGRSCKRSFGISTPAKAQTSVLVPPTKSSSSISTARPSISVTRITTGSISWIRKRTKR